MNKVKVLTTVIDSTKKIIQEYEIIINEIEQIDPQERSDDDEKFLESYKSLSRQHKLALKTALSARKFAEKYPDDE